MPPNLRSILALSSALGAAVAAAGGLLFSSAACGPGFDADEALTRTGTVTLGAEDLLIIDTAVDLIVQADRRTAEVTWSFEGTVSATSASAAQNLAESVDIVVDQDDDDALQLTLADVDRGRIEGLWRVSAPADLDVEVLGRGGSQLVDGFEGTVRANGVLGVAVLDARGDVFVASNAGEVLIESMLPSGTVIDVETGASIQLAIPLAFGARIEAQAGPNGEIIIQHPRLPQWLGSGLPYVVSVGDALSQVRLVSRAGSVFITPPL